MDDVVTPPENPDDAGVKVAIGDATAKYLDDRAAESFKRQTDLEESVWRSLPLFTGGLIAAGAIISSTAKALPPFGMDLYRCLAYGALLLATGTFAVAFWWLWQVVRPREFDYPADDELIAAYANDMLAFHAGSGLTGETLDATVARELRLYMANTFAIAAKSTFANNQRRLSARGQVLVFLLSGFLLAFVCDAIIYGHRLIFSVDPIGASNDGASTHLRTANPRITPTSEPAVAAANAGNPGRRLADKEFDCPASQGQINGRRRQADQRGRRAGDNPSCSTSATPTPTPHQSGVGARQRASEAAGAKYTE
ncbi:hypothetical protein [Sphingomonas glacialis]|uniref:hypothetical protein n=1 Tax=Sphingomonas glacialis TaxID=658225 RepID=UPI00112BD850|nr:hypothetical protein [Sphingomonas glacialis]